MRLALELADAGLLALPEEGEAAAPSPGFAIVDGDEITVGRKAAVRSRLTPRRLHNRFWHEISAEPIGRPFGRRLRSADLAWTHLSELWHQIGRGVDSVILAVPSGYSETQLGLILGVARSAEMPVDGMVDAAVAATVGGNRTKRVLHLDVELHRTVVTVLEPGPRRHTVFTSERVGLAALRDGWLRLVAGAFLKDTRFDPFHSAASEQNLDDRLTLALEELRRKESITVSLAADQRLFSIDLSRDRVIATAERPYTEIDELVRTAMTHQPAALQLTARAASAPGLAHRLAELTALEPTPLPLAAAAAGALQFAEQIVVPEIYLPFVTDLSGAPTEPADTSPERLTDEIREPTHLLIGGVAHPMDSESLWLGSSPDAGEYGVTIGAGDGSILPRHCVIRRRDGQAVVEDLSGGTCFVNDRPLSGQTQLAAGDRLRLGSPGVEIVLLAVEHSP